MLFPHQKKQDDNWKKKQKMTTEKKINSQINYSNLNLCCFSWGFLDSCFFLLDSLDPKKKGFCTYILPSGHGRLPFALMSTCVCPLSFTRSPPKMYGMVSWTVVVVVVRMCDVQRCSTERLIMVEK